MYWHAGKICGVCRKSVNTCSAAARVAGTW
jgi:hypothetical protein